MTPAVGAATFPDARDRVLAWGTGPSAAVPDLTLDELIADAVARFPEAVAVVEGPRRLTYRELAEAATPLAARLQAVGAGPGTTVGVCVRRTALLPAVLLGVLQSGAAYVPLDPSLPGGRIQTMLADAAPCACVVDADTRDLLPEGFGDVVDLDTHDPSAPLAGRRAARDDLAYVLFTSGSTGRPKGVCVEHAAVVDFVVNNARAYGIGPGTRVLAMASIGFDVSVAEIFTALAVGATLVMADDVHRHDADLLVDLLRRERVAVAELPPALLGVLDPDDLPDLELASVGGEAPAARQVARWVAAGKRVINAYGPTETTVTATLMECGASDEPTVPIGRPMANHRGYVLDETGELVAPETPGELWVAGPGVARGYLGPPEVSAERFRPDPFAPGRMYRTGDRVRWRRDGVLEFLGRVDGQLNLRGYRIEPGEVEHWLRTCPWVAEAAVAVRDDGSGPRLVGYVVPQPGSAVPGLTLPLDGAVSVDVGGLLAEVPAVLPGYMVPSTVVAVARLPLTASGKVDRDALSEPPGRPRVVVGPRDDVEKTVVELWREVLPADTDVGVEDDFFELGGHSLLGMRLLGRLRRTFGVALTPADLSAAPTVAALADRLRATSSAASSRAGTAARDRAPAPAGGPRASGTASLSLAQRRLWVAQRLAPDTPAYHLPAAFRLRGLLDVERLIRALTEVADRHDALRTSFPTIDGQPVARVATAVPLPLLHADLRSAPHAAGEEQLRRVLDTAVREPFPYEVGPLWRCVLARVDDEEHVLVLVLHHAIADGWSLSILLDELGACYAGRRDGLSQLTVSHADFAEWQLSQLDSPEMRAGVSFWMRTLAGAPPALSLPADRPRPPVQTFAAGRVQTTLLPDLTDRLRELARARRTTPYATLLAVFGLVLSRWSGSDDLVVSCPMAGRSEPDLESVVGLLVDTVPVRLDVSRPDGTAAELIDRTTAAVLDARTHSQVPFELIVQAVRPPRDPSRSPLAQVGFNLLSYPPERLELRGVRATELRLDPPGSLLDLTLYLRESGRGLGVEAVYNRDLFDALRITALLDCFTALLGQVVSDPDAIVGDLSLVTQDARRVLPDPTLGLSADCGPSVTERVADRARTAPHRPAVVGSDVTYDYGELDVAGRRVAGSLRVAGIGPGDVVTIAAARTAHLPVALLGVLTAGAAAHLVDASHPPARLAEAVAAARSVGWLAVDSDAAGPAAAAGWRYRGTVADALRGSTASPAHAGALDDPAFVLATSGSTGASQAVTSTGRPLAHFVDWYGAELGVGPGDRVALTSGVAHDPVLRDVLVPLALGATVVVPPTDVHRAPDRLLAWLAESDVTVLHVAPQLARLLAAASRSAAERLPRLRLLVTGGDVLRGCDIGELSALAPASRIIAGYGATETPQLAGWQSAEADRERERVSLGRGIPDTQLLVTTASGAQAGVGELGEIVVRSPFLAEGYLGDPTLSAARFLPDAAGARRYRTGDLGRYLPDGRVEFVGRRDGQVKIRGFRVETGDVAAALRRFPEVADAVVVATGKGGDDLALAAYVVAAGATPPHAPELLRRRLRSVLPEPAVPVAVVWVDELPVTGNGKIDLAALATVPRPRPAEPATAEAAASSTALERSVAHVWRSVLGLSGVGPDDNFFDVGGTSLRLVDVQAQLHRVLGRRVPIVDLFQFPTVSSLAAHLSGQTAGIPADPASVRRIEARRDRRRARAAAGTPVTTATDPPSTAAAS